MRLDLHPTLDDVLARLPPRGDVAVVRDGESTVIALRPLERIEASGAEALRALDGLDGWWAGFLSYDLGRAVERVPTIAREDPPLPDLALARFDERIVVTEARTPVPADVRRPEPDRLDQWHSSLGRAEWTDAVHTILDHLRDGDAYQVNLTRRLECDRTIDPVSLFRALAAANPAPHAALVRIGDTTVVSASPERFLRRDGLAIETRPIKGTAADADVLQRSEKDRAENVMIVDLARNDLGRICEYGTIHVPSLFEIETHPGLHHLVSTVRGRLRDHASVGDVIRATFPPASVTGCPKPRVLQIIEELEPVRRGVYCGAVGFIDTDREVIDLNVAIRTFTMTDGRTFFGVGGGIVADSDPDDEWDETELKARRLLALASG